VAEKCNSLQTALIPEFEVAVLLINPLLDIYITYVLDSCVARRYTGDLCLALLAGTLPTCALPDVSPRGECGPSADRKVGRRWASVHSAWPHALPRKAAFAANQHKPPLPALIRCDYVIPLSTPQRSFTPRLLSTKSELQTLCDFSTLMGWGSLS
jgi:hypothetical protein